WTPNNLPLNALRLLRTLAFRDPMPTPENCADASTVSQAQRGFYWLGGGNASRDDSRTSVTGSPSVVGAVSLCLLSAGNCDRMTQHNIRGSDLSVVLRPSSGENDGSAMFALQR